MKKLIITAVALAITSHGYTQDFGLSFSYFIPRDGYFSTPISPFSIRGVGVDLTRYLALETGATLYRMSGLNVRDIPLRSAAPLVGPNFTVFVPAELVLQLKGQSVEFDIKGGGFFFYGLDHKINHGNFDKAIREYESWSVADADVDFRNHPGFGYHAGVELTVFVTDAVGVSLETNYLMGKARFPITGSYRGGTASIETRQIDYADATLDLTGLEFSVGLIFSSGSQPARPQKKRR